MKIFAAIIAVVLVFSWFAHDKYEQRETKILYVRIRELNDEVARTQCMASNEMLKLRRKVDETKAALILLYPDNAKQIEKAFSPKAAPQEGAPEADKQSAAEKTTK